MPQQIYLQPKLNGLRCRAYYASGKFRLLSSECSIITMVPHINEFLEELHESDCCPNHLDGELYIHGMPLQKIRSIVGRSKNLHPDYIDMQYHIYDVITVEEQHQRFRRLVRLQNFIKNNRCKDFNIKIVNPVKKDNDPNVIYTWLDTFTGLGFEGVIIRDPLGLYEKKKSRFLLKLKKKERGYFLITSSFEAIDKHGMFKGMLGGFNLRTEDGQSFKCGAGCLTHEERVEYWNRREDFPGKMAFIEYPELTERKVPSQGILIEVVE